VIVVALVAGSKPVPVIVTGVPPTSGPEPGETEVTVGGALYWNWSLREVAEVPLGVVTVTSTEPGLPAGDVAKQVVVDEQLGELPG
jgi:hypothetical protein